LGVQPRIDLAVHRISVPTEIEHVALFVKKKMRHSDDCLPVMKEAILEAERRHVELLIVPTNEALRLMEKESEANAILHVTC
jgi:hypothetical protein